MSGTVTVACKLPIGIRLHLDDMIDAHEPVMGGGTRPIKKAVRRPGSVVLKGPATLFGVAPTCPIVGGYALTPGVDADWFAEWSKQNAESDLVKNRIIFASATQDAIEKRAKENAQTMSGLEPLNPETTTRVVKGEVTKVQIDPRFPRRIEKSDARP